LPVFSCENRRLFCRDIEATMARAHEHHYQTTVTWTGNTGTGTKTYAGYARAHEISSPGKPTIRGSSDPAFRGDATRWNPEDLLLASLSACHKLWYLHLCAVAGVVVTAYVDQAEGVMIEDPVKGGFFTHVVLRPTVTITSDSDEGKAIALHHDAHAKCYIANSVNFPVDHEPTIIKA
jgi:organic hydroperoxide reductase OsmC/OhrA